MSNWPPVIEPRHLGEWFIKHGAGFCLSLIASASSCVAFTFCFLASLLWSSCLSYIHPCTVLLSENGISDHTDSMVLSGVLSPHCCCVILSVWFYPGHPSLQLGTLVPIHIPVAARGAICYSEPPPPRATTSIESPQVSQCAHFFILPSCPLFILVWLFCHFL